jgi:haloacetate dehalogenase
MTVTIPGLESRDIVVGGRTLMLDIGGSGPPLLLLHGFPQTRIAWRSVAPQLAESYQVVCPDLPGYGDSERLGDGPDGFDKATIAAHMVQMMRTLGHDRFAVVGHDRGALVGFRMALNHPDAVTHLGVLDVVPTVDNWASLHGTAGVFAFHLYLLAQPSDLPERLVAADPDTFLGHFLDSWYKVPDAIPPSVRDHYLAALRSPDAIHAICDDYRASAFIDTHHDQADQQARRQLTMPVLAAWQDPGDIVLPFDPLAIWSSWAPNLRTTILPCGHFIPEEQPQRLVEAITDLLHEPEQPNQGQIQRSP